MNRVCTLTKYLQAENLSTYYDIQVAYNNLLKMRLFAKYFHSTKFDLNI